MTYLIYSDLIQLETFEERFNYLKLSGTPAEETFGSLRHANQTFYKSNEWRRVRNLVISRDGGYDLGIVGMKISGRVIVHHMNPITPHTLVHSVELALDPEYLISVSHKTHLAIHFGLQLTKQEPLIKRKPGDTTLW